MAHIQPMKAAATQDNKKLCDIQNTCEKTRQNVQCSNSSLAKPYLHGGKVTVKIPFFLFPLTKLSTPKAPNHLKKLHANYMQRKVDKSVFTP